MEPTHFAVIYFSGDPEGIHSDPELAGQAPRLTLITVGDEDHCWQALAERTETQPLRSFERAEVLQMRKDTSISDRP